MFDGIVAKIAAHAILGPVLARAKSGTKAAWSWLTGLNFYQLGCIALLLFGAWQTVGRWSQHRHTVKVEKQLSASIGQLKLARANEATLEAAIGRQNAAIANLVTASQNLQVSAAKAKAVAAPRAAEAESVSARLKASARATPASSASCEPSDTLKEQWK